MKAAEWLRVSTGEQDTSNQPPALTAMREQRGDELDSNGEWMLRLKPTGAGVRINVNGHASTNGKASGGNGSPASTHVQATHGPPRTASGALRGRNDRMGERHPTQQRGSQRAQNASGWLCRILAGDEPMTNRVVATLRWLTCSVCGKSGLLVVEASGDPLVCGNPACQAAAGRSQPMNREES